MYAEEFISGEFCEIDCGVFVGFAVDLIGSIVPGAVFGGALVVLDSDEDEGVNSGGACVEDVRFVLVFLG